MAAVIGAAATRLAARQAWDAGLRPAPGRGLRGRGRLEGDEDDTMSASPSVRRDVRASGPGMATGRGAKATAAIMRAAIS